MKTIGHHTLENQANYKDLEQAGPILAEYEPKENKLPFLGSGYYFWDDNFEMAMYWGRVKYKGNHYIFEGNLNLDDETFLDLVGSRSNMNLFRELLARFKKFNNGREWPIGKFIEFLKSLEAKEEYKGIFPFQSFRAIDTSAKIIAKYRFSEDRNNFTDLNPRIVICLVEKNNLNLPAFKKIYPED